ncbi:hypothetical protein CXG81DRAFT_8813 [Caulochytrium protostelioides]|uniref:C3H1-type domain-containing protein n=1 Tax=Caulochytrium protostelioides TaxID=1555241 RepID=A0A4P9XEQ8_9FUNG|nr:hypothetical protein CXG81DRAFT_8813 [Caulochytrium protostelioides]|eukprot:RKP04018.1 hypothetical protein CXG81DRAFT_8813 [Caulochytrium protostelioides]
MAATDASATAAAAAATAAAPAAATTTTTTNDTAAPASSSLSSTPSSSQDPPEGAARSLHAGYNAVNRTNIASYAPMILEVLRHTAFYAVDCEFTGLGAGTRAADMGDRYEAMRRVVGAHALVAVGLSLFVRDPLATDMPRYIVHTFDLSVLSCRDHTVSPRSMQFLAEAGFDFNALYRYGIPFTPGARPSSMKRRKKPETADETGDALLRAIFRGLLGRGIPTVVHNGLLDLAFLYNAFVGELPEAFDTFVADLALLYPGGLYDTKYIAEYEAAESASFLQFLHCKYERTNRKYPAITYVVAPPLPSPRRVRGVPGVPQPAYRGKTPLPENKKPYCEQFANHGYCNSGARCPNSHDMDLILDTKFPELKLRQRKPRSRRASSVHSADGSVAPDAAAPPAKRSRVAATGTAVASHDAPDPATLIDARADAAATATATSTAAPLVGGPVSHSASFDAYMTGCVFAHQIHHPMHPRAAAGSTDPSNGDADAAAAADATTAASDRATAAPDDAPAVPEWQTRYKNKVYLMSKQVPLKVFKSTFTKASDTAQAFPFER